MDFTTKYLFTGRNRINNLNKDETEAQIAGSRRNGGADQKAGI